MKLVRNTTQDGKCKYAIIDRNKGDTIEYGLPRTEHEFFVIKLKDKYAKEALDAYAEAVRAGGEDPEYAKEVQELADRAGARSKWCHSPD